MGVIPRDLDADIVSGAVSNVIIPVPQSSTLLTAYYAIQIIPSNFGLPILIATFSLAKSVKRPPLLINLMICWVIGGVLGCLLCVKCIFFPVIYTDMM